jgi:outer membrane lipoprotein-sorting protein
MRRIVAGVTTCIALTSMAFAGDGITLDAHQKDLVDKVSRYFTAIHTMQGSFLQTDSADRRMKGRFYLSRPGRFRFDYARPSRQIVVSDGQTLAVQDLDLNNEDRVALDQTVFRLLLSSDVDIVRDAKVMEVEESADLIAVTLQDNDPNVPGQLKLILAVGPDLELKAWSTKDAQGVETRVEVSDLAKGVQLDADLFKIAPLAWVE